MTDFHISRASEMGYDADALEAVIDAAPRSEFRFHKVGLEESEPDIIVATDLSQVDAELRRRYPTGLYGMEDLRTKAQDAFSLDQAIALCVSVGLEVAADTDGGPRLVVRDRDRIAFLYWTAAVDGSPHVEVWQVQHALRDMAWARYDAALRRAYRDHD